MGRDKQGNIYSILIRYSILVVLAVSSFRLFYVIFTPLTIYPVFFLLKIFYNVSLSGTLIFFDHSFIQLVDACIAGSAYYLLIVLNLTTPMPVKKIVPSLLFTLLAFLFINVFRIFLFSILFFVSSPLFSIFHLIFWYALSAVFVFAVWFANTKLFNIKEIPVYSDFKFLYSSIVRNKS